MIAGTNVHGQVLSFIRLGRPHFLVGGVLMHGLGVAVAHSVGVPLSLPALVGGQVAITSTQLMTHYSNEYFDLPADLANTTHTRWSGGSRVLPGGRLQPWVALAAALTLGVLAIITALVLTVVIQPGSLTLPLLILALVLAWGYSAPPLRLHSRGLGELTTALLVPGLTPLLGFYLQAGRLESLPLLAVLPLCCLQFAMLLLIEFPDAAGDAVVGKRTLVVRLGGAGAARLYAGVLLIGYLMVPALVLAGLPSPAAAAIALTAPASAWQAWRVLRGAWVNPSRWNSLGFWGIVILMSTTALEVLAFLELLPAPF
jgi:1,4-dihydroxy-2-naphthoate octaprenyltransferase